MKVLFVAATLPEIASSIQLLEQKNIDYIITGVGMLSTSYALSKKLQKSRYDLIINVGIAGILDPQAPLGKVYQLLTDQIYEFGAEDQESFVPIETLGFGKAQYTQRLPLQPIALPECDSAVGITVNKVHGSQASTAKLRSEFDGTNLLESMEGVAVFMVAEMENTPVLQFRASSNHILPRNKDTWEIGLAIESLSVFIQKLVQDLA